jgi:hypothetical protein
VAVAAVAGSSGCGTTRAAKGTPAYSVDVYLTGLRDANATETISVTSDFYRASMPPLPELIQQKMKADAKTYGRILSWQVTSSNIDEANGQALLTESVASEKTLVTMQFDLRKVGGKWQIYGVLELDRVRNPALTKRLPSDIGRPNPFNLR